MRGGHGVLDGNPGVGCLRAVCVCVCHNSTIKNSGPKIAGRRSM